MFVDLGKDYGNYVKPNGAEGRRSLAEMAARTGLVVPANEAYLLISRQTFTYRYYNDLIEDILELGSKSRAKKVSSAKSTPNVPVDTAMANLTLAPAPLKASIADVVDQGVEQKAASEDYLGLLRSAPVVLNQAVNMTDSSRPELIPTPKDASFL